MVSRANLGNFKILAVATEQVASRSANGEDFHPWMEMVDGFLLDRPVDHGRHFAISQQGDLSFNNSSNLAFPYSALRQFAKKGAK